MPYKFEEAVWVAVCDAMPIGKPFSTGEAARAIVGYLPPKRYGCGIRGFEQRVATTLAHVASLPPDDGVKACTRSGVGAGIRWTL